MKNYKAEVEQLKEILQADKRFIKYNNGKEIKTIVVRIFDETINYLVNDTILVRVDLTSGNIRKYNYLSISKQPKKWLEVAYNCNYIKYEF